MLDVECWLLAVGCWFLRGELQAYVWTFEDQQRQRLGKECNLMFLEFDFLFTRTIQK